MSIPTDPLNISQEKSRYCSTTETSQTQDPDDNPKSQQPQVSRLSSAKTSLPFQEPRLWQAVPPREPQRAGLRGGLHHAYLALRDGVAGRPGQAPASACRPSPTSASCPLAARRPGPHLEVGAQAASAPRLVGDLVRARHQQVLVDLLAETLARVHGQMEGDAEDRAGAEQEQKEQGGQERARPG